jgi:hypothetical protein
MYKYTTIFIILLLAVPAFSLSSVKTTVYVLSEPEIENIKIIESNQLTCSWNIVDFDTEETHFSDVIWFRNNEFHSEQQLTCTECSSSVPIARGDWKCSVTVRDSGGLTSSAETTLTTSAITGLFTLDTESLSGITEGLQDIISSITEIIPKIMEFFS